MCEQREMTGIVFPGARLRCVPHSTNEVVISQIDCHNRLKGNVNDVFELKSDFAY